MGVKEKGKKKNEVNVLEAREVLEKVKNNEISIEEAEKYFKKEPFEEMGYAKLDTHREIRSGFAEVIFCARKADEHLLKIFTRLYEQDGEVFGTRASEHQYEPVSYTHLDVYKRQVSGSKSKNCHHRNRWCRTPSLQQLPNLQPLRCNR